MSRTVLITGASSGIGEALAVRYARDGATLALLGRNAERLEACVKACREAGAGEIATAAIDVRAAEALNAWIADYDRRHPIDIAVANAGITGGTGPDGRLETPDDSRRLFEVNVIGVTNTVNAVLPAMIARRRGQIALMSSLAAFVPLPDSPSYCASKAAVLHFGLALRGAVRSRGVRVSVICPGYIDTPMSRRLTGDKPSLISATQAAETIHRGLSRDKRIIAFPRGLAFTTRMLAKLPHAMTRWTMPSFRVLPLD